MDAPRPAVRFSAIVVEIRALGSHVAAIFLKHAEGDSEQTLYFLQKVESIHDLKLIIDFILNVFIK